METDRPSEKGFQTACRRIGTDRLISTILNHTKPTMLKTKRNAEALLFKHDALQNYLLAADAALAAAAAVLAGLSPQAVKNKDIKAAAKRDFFMLNT